MAAEDVLRDLEVHFDEIFFGDLPGAGNRREIFRIFLEGLHSPTGWMHSGLSLLGELTRVETGRAFISGFD